MTTNATPDALSIEIARSVALEQIVTHHDDSVPASLVARYRNLSDELATAADDDGYLMTEPPVPSRLRRLWGWED